MAINVGDIGRILNIAYKMRQAGKLMVPCFEGPSGIGKSQATHQWIAQMAKTIPGFRMIDLRGATIDSSDTRGLPWKDEKTGQTVFLPPDFLPRDEIDPKTGKVIPTHGVLFIDEINRSATPVMNCFMELFTEGTIGNYKLPMGWFPCTAINPSDNEAYDVNAMDAALANRVKRFEVKFDHKVFIAFCKKIGMNPKMIAYLQSGQWVYKEPGEGDGVYISPRSWVDLHFAELAGALDEGDLHSDFAQAYLGKGIGNDYWNFCHKTKPVLYDEMDKEFSKFGRKPERIMDMESIKALAAYADPTKNATIRGDLVNATVTSIQAKADKGVQHVDETILYAVVQILPPDQSVALLQNLALKAQDPPSWVINAKKKYANVYGRLRTGIVKEGVKTEGATQ